jgi:hypothetical protein
MKAASAPVRDLRPTLRFPQATWDRATEEGRRRLRREAARIGYRLVFVGDEGQEWFAEEDLRDWR